MNRLRKTGWMVLLVAVLLAGCGKNMEKQIAEQLELASLYEEQNDYEQGMEILKNGIENISSPEELRKKFREIVDSYREYLLDTIKKQFKTEKRGLAFNSYGANGEYGLFMLGRMGEAAEEDIYYCGDNGKICEWLGTLKTSGFIIVENGTIKYFCPYSRTEGMVFGVEDGKPFTLAEKLEIPEGETEQIEAYFNEVVAQKVE